MTVTDTLNPNNITNVLSTVDDPGAAKGVGVELLYNGLQQRLGKDSALPGNPGQILLGGVQGDGMPLTHRLQFGYIQTEPKVISGTVKAYASFTMSYQ